MVITNGIYDANLVVYSREVRPKVSVTTSLIEYGADYMGPERFRKIVVLGRLFIPQFYICPTLVVEGWECSPHAERCLETSKKWLERYAPCGPPSEVAYACQVMNHLENCL